MQMVIIPEIHSAWQQLYAKSNFMPNYLNHNTTYSPKYLGSFGRYYQGILHFLQVLFLDKRTYFSSGDASQPLVARIW